MTSEESALLRQTLCQRNATLINSCKAMESSLNKATIPSLLRPYQAKIIELCHQVEKEAQENLLLLMIASDSIIEDVISKTQQATRYFNLVSVHFAAPVLRCSPEDDYLCLKILTWLHQSHYKTVNAPVAFTMGGVSIRTFQMALPIYYFPASEQSKLLHQPLHYHEFGHGLYVLHEKEMDDLVKEVQLQLTDILTPQSRRNDRRSQEQTAQRERIVNRWFDWMQELFCDAVGLQMAGSAYLYAFSDYCNNLSQSDFYAPDDYLARSPHPITWLRIRFLVRRAKELGLTEAAEKIETEWATLARTLKIREEHHGYFEESMADGIHKILGDMLTVADVRPFSPEESNPTVDTQSGDTPVFLLNRAWQKYLSDPNNYPAWEQQAIAIYVQDTVAP